jgi:nucleotide-binding universal stress UspA family protein
VTDHRIVVGVDGTDGGRRALRWAVHEPTTRGGSVQAVMSWRWDTDDETTAPPPTGVGPRGSGSRRERAEQTLRTEIADQTAAVPATAGVTVAAEVVEGRAAQVLCDAARDADLLVLGSHGHDRVYRTVLGSVAQEVVDAAPCPVVVIPSTWTGPARPPVPAVPR